MRPTVLFLGCFVLLALLPASSADDCDCLSDPTAMCCMSWTYQYAANDVTSLCNSMTMFACGINSYCSKQKTTAGYCDPFSILADICVVDSSMSGMPGCSNYTKLCSNLTTTMVTQCTSNKPMPNVLTTDTAETDIKNTCSMSMDQCKQCVVESTGQACDCGSLSSTCVVKSPATLLSVLSDACLAMSGMSSCNDFKTMCSSAGSEFDKVCKGSGGGGGGSGSSKLCNGQGTIMFMSGFKGFLKEDDTCVSYLFASWVLDTRVKLAFGLIGAFVQAMLHGLLCRYSKKHNKKNPHTSDASQFWHDVVRFLFLVAEGANSYALMLLAMTYYAGLFLAVVFGLALGKLMFDREGGASHCGLSESTPLNREDVLHYN